MSAPAATEAIPATGYLSPLWHEYRRKTVSASEVAAVLGISPYTSPFDLWWAKRLGDVNPETPAMRRGKRLEPLILEDFQEEHPEFYLDRAGLYVNAERPWQACTPDALAYETAGWAEGRDPVAVVEAKTAGSRDGWGTEGTDEIPAHYRAQVLWQMDTLGLSVAYVPVWIGFDYREYVVTYDASDVALMRHHAREFLDSLEAGDPPSIDSHPATGRRLKQLHPSVIDGEVEVMRAWVNAYHRAKRGRDAGQRLMDMAEHNIRQAMGDHRYAVVDGQKVATRSVTDVPERTQTVKAHTRNTIRFAKWEDPA